MQSEHLHSKKQSKNTNKHGCSVYSDICGPHVTQRLGLKLSGIVHATVELKIEMRNVVVCKLAVFIRTVLFVGMVFPLVVRSSHVRGSPPELVL